MLNLLEFSFGFLGMCLLFLVDFFLFVFFLAG